MAGLPKIALARLKANSGAPKSSGGPEGQAGIPGAHHPDANLLAAFVEKTLTEKERTRVLHHLAQCAECREVAAFALPAEVAVAEPIRVPAARRWSPWLVLRWGAMAAVLGVLTVVVVRHADVRNTRQEISQATRPPAPTGNPTGAPQSVSTPPLAQPSPEAYKAKAPAEVQESADKLEAVKKAPEQQQELTLRDHAALAQTRHQVATMASTQPPTPFRTENVPAIKAEQKEVGGGNPLTAEAKVAPLPAPAPAAVPTSASEDATKTGAESQAGPATVRATNQSTAVAGGNAGGSSAEVVPAKPAAPVSAQASFRMAAQAPTPLLRTSRQGIALGAGQPSTLWSVSLDGKVQRSTDGGKTIEPIPVARGIKFRAIAALGNDVWAGGAGGALFRSPDGGATWTRTSIDFDGSTLTEMIASIRLRDPQHLTVTTASGSEWVSEDGGQHWQKPQ
jgi:hypothetical protein